MAKPNYSFEKRQRELAKKKKKEEKEKEKADRKVAAPGADSAAEGQPVNQAPADPAMGPTGG
ncbi:MAG TPA: hypothetical protein VHM00_10865 [Caldimonas sp.]|nr:hypothetical protein [Caldimonas sp.]HEX2541568.1 hypothetical protein [Caldimonas sp.]